MRKFRMFGAGVTIAALLGAVASTGTAGAATSTGVGTSKASDSILNVALGSNGSLLNLRPLEVRAKIQAYIRSERTLNWAR